MDTSHVTLVSLMMRDDGFEHYRCDRSLSLGLNFASITKVLKCATNDDVITLKAEDQGDTLTLMFESPSKFSDFGVAVAFRLPFFALFAHPYSCFPLPSPFASSPDTTALGVFRSRQDL